VAWIKQQGGDNLFTVLLVEDEELERRYLKSLLEKSSWGYKVVGEACNGREGIELHSSTGYCFYGYQNARH
jgi:YesN/AraC family two-component response regulator